MPSSQHIPYSSLPLKHPENAKVPEQPEAQSKSYGAIVRKTINSLPIILINDGIVAVLSIAICLLFYTQL